MGIYHKKVMNEIKRLCKIHNPKSILDFGCGSGELKKYMGDKVIGFDIDKSLTDVKNYRTLRPDVIVCNHVLEHMTANEVVEAFDNFLIMNPKVILIVGSPTENLLSKLIGFFHGVDNHIEHRLKLYYINELLSKRFRMLYVKNIFTMTELSCWKSAK